MTTADLQRYLEIGSLPVTVHSMHVYAGIWRCIRVTRPYTVFLDFDTSTDDAETEGGFRVTFRYPSLDTMIAAIEAYTGEPITQWIPNPQTHLPHESPDFAALAQDVYAGQIPFLPGAVPQIGDFYWRGLYEQAFAPGASAEEIMAWVKSQSIE